MQNVWRNNFIDYRRYIGLAVYVVESDYFENYEITK